MKIRAFGIVTAVVALFTLAGCGDYEPGTGTRDSMDYYIRFREPSSLANYNRITVQQTKVEKITFPEYLFGNENTSSIAISDENILEGYGIEGMSVFIRGKNPGLARVTLRLDGTERASVVVFVTENKNFYTHQGMSMGKPQDPKWWSSNEPDNFQLSNKNKDDFDIGGYKTEPTYQLAWKYRNPNESSGAEDDDKPCGIDMLAYVVDRDDSSKRGWVRTTYDFGGWHYDLNGVTNKMSDGVQVDEEKNVKLELKPEFVYDKGVPYLQITHILTNNNKSSDPPPVKDDPPAEDDPLNDDDPPAVPDPDGTLTNLKFGAWADVTFFNDEFANTLTRMPYGVLMTKDNPATLKFRLVCLELEGISEASTIWMGTYEENASEHIYQNKRPTTDVTGDTALCFSYQNIKLKPGESKKYVIRLTQVQ